MRQNSTAPLGHLRARIIALPTGLLVALTAGCRAQTAPSAPPVPVASTRVVSLTRGSGLSGITFAVEVREAAAAGVSGTMRVSSGDVNRQFVESTYGCHPRRTADATGPEEWSCQVPFVRGAPDWAALLSRLDALGLMAPPAAPVPGGSGVETACHDGFPWALLVRRAAPDSVVMIRERESCGPLSERRAAFEAGIDSVWSAIDAAARVR
jgi:hypothetical protein